MSPGAKRRGGLIEAGASAIAVIAALAVLGAGGFVAYRFYSAGATKQEIDKEASEALERAFTGKPVKQVAEAFQAFARERGCEAASGLPRIRLEPADNPDEGSLTFDCSLRVDLLVVKLAKSVAIEKTRKRSAAFRTIQDVKARLGRAQEVHDQRIEKRFREAE